MTLPGPIAEAAGAAPAAKPDRPAAEELCQLVRELLDLPAELTPGLECIEHIDVAIRLCRPRAREPKILNSAIPYLSQISRRRVSSIATPGTIITIRFAIWDAGNYEFDSTVLIDNFQWNATGGTIAVGTTPVPTPK